MKASKWEILTLLAQGRVVLSLYKILHKAKAWHEDLFFPKIIISVKAIAAL